MSLRPLLLMLILALLAACGGQSPDTDTVATPAAEPPSPAVDAPAAADPARAAETPTEAAPADTAATPPAEAREATGEPSGPAPVIGVDYTRIEPATLAEPNADKIEVAEVFGYTCIHCASLQPLINRWKSTLADDVNFLYVPAAFGGFWTPYARAFYTAEAMGVRERTHDALFAALHQQRALPFSADAGPRIAQWYGRHGVDPQVFASTMDSFAVNAKIARSQQLLQRWGIEATPTLVVAGKYKVLATAEGGHEGMLRTVDWLIANERAARRQ